MDESYRTRKYQHLTPIQIESFMAHGFIHLRNCWSRSTNATLTSTLWSRLKMDPNDKSTWKEITYLPATQSLPVSTFAPEAYAVMCELLGGKNRVEGEGEIYWDDGFIVNLGSDENEGIEKARDRKKGLGDADGFHTDGDFFVHYLDSPEQGLLVLPLFSDILPGGGGTVIAPDAVDRVARWLYDHPGGVTTGVAPYHGKPENADEPMWPEDFRKEGDRYYECAGEVGDVFVCHPLMLHSANQNWLRRVRLIVNGNVGLSEPFKFDRRDKGELSLVELKTMKCLGEERGWGTKWRSKGEKKVFDKEENERVEKAWADGLERLREEKDADEKNRSEEGV